MKNLQSQVGYAKHNPDIQVRDSQSRDGLQRSPAFNSGFQVQILHIDDNCVDGFRLINKYAIVKPFWIERIPS